MNLKRSILASLSLLLLVGCSKELEPKIESEHPQTNATHQVADTAKRVAIGLNLEAGIDLDELRNLSYKIDANGTELDVLEEKPLHSLCIIANEDGSTRHFVPLTWNKTPGDKHFYIRRLMNVLDANGQAITLDPDQRWFISGYLTYNKGNIQSRRVVYNPNNLTPLKGITASEKEIKDVPLYFTWVPLTLHNQGQDATALIAESGRTEAEKIRIKPFGVMMRIKVTNREAYKVKVKSLRLRSTVITPQNGFVDLSLCSAPNVAAAQQTIPYKPNIVQNDHQLPIATSFNLSPEESYDKYYLVWGMPITPASGVKRQTHLLADVSRLDGNNRELPYPKMKTLYVWGSDSNNPQHQTRRLIHAQIYRPKMALEYISNGYLTKSGKFAPQGTATDPLVRVTYNQLQSLTLPAGYRLPESVDLYTVFPTSGTSSVTFNNTTELRVGLNAGFPLRINGVENQNYFEHLKGGNPYVYVLRFDDGKLNRRQYSAWRYSTSGVVEAIYLGPNFKGDFEDIQQPWFWQLHQADIIRRTFAPATATFVELDGSPLRPTNREYAKASITRFEASILAWAQPNSKGQLRFIGVNTTWFGGQAVVPNKVGSDVAFSFRTESQAFQNATPAGQVILMQVNNSDFPPNN